MTHKINIYENSYTLLINTELEIKVNDVHLLMNNTFEEGSKRDSRGCINDMLS